MANARIRWTQRVCGRAEGHVEICEIDTPFMQGCLKNLRYEVLEIIEPPKPESELIGLTKPKPAAPKAKATRGDDGV